MPSKVKLKKEDLKSDTKGEMITRGIQGLLSPVGAWARKRLAENIMPWNYGDLGTGRSALKRGAEAILLGKKEPERVEKEQYLEKGYGAVATDEDKLRLDLLSMYGGIKPKYGTLKQSAHRPIMETDKSTKYLDSDVIKRGVAENLPPIRNRQEFENYLKSISTSEIERDGVTVARGKTGGVKTKVTGLGTANIAYGEDAKGPYISYYDKWDIDPTSGKYSQKEGFVKDVLKSVGKEVLEAGSKPPEIYGRVYLDKKTGKPIL